MAQMLETTLTGASDRGVNKCSRGVSLKPSQLRWDYVTPNGANSVSMENQMKTIILPVLGLGLLAFGVDGQAQENPLVEAGIDYSYVRYVPRANYTPAQNLNGGGGSIVFNVLTVDNFPDTTLGLKGDLQIYGSTTSKLVIPVGSPNFPA